MSTLNPKRLWQQIKNTFWHLPKSLFFAALNGFPSHHLILIGVTGTDGKTTTATLIHQALLTSGHNAALISTLGAMIGDKTYTTGLHTTSPSPAIFQKMLKHMVRSGVTHAVIEVTAHALDQYRFFPARFHIGVLTNISHEHLDDFIDLPTYVKAKARLFNRSQTAILNRDDKSFPAIKALLTVKPLTYAINHPANFRATNVSLSSQTLKLKINDHGFITDSPYRYQAYNILAAYAVCCQLKIKTKYFAAAINPFPAIKGRRETVENDLGIRTIIDFAHTPAALEATLTSLKQSTPGNLIVIFGATGGRDQSKRPLMGRVVSQNANIALITADDTRQENITDINRQIISGIDPTQSQAVDPSALISAKDFKSLADSAKKTFTYLNVSNRQDAFNLALKLAQKGDTIIACGKGHETTILHGKTEYPWSESEAFRTAFKQVN